MEKQKGFQILIVHGPNMNLLGNGSLRSMER